jgi:WS/DGAT/MGAT family acyltransferase
MYKLGALDAGFLYAETSNCPQHIASVQVLELPPGVDETEFLKRLRALMMTRIHLVPYFTNRLQQVPFNLDHPVWVKDRSFQIENHVKAMEVPAPGGRAEMEATIARLHEQHLDRSRPLWDLWVLTGLEHGRVALYNRCHHACLDGVAGQLMIEAIMDIGPEPRVVEPAPEGFLTASDEQTPAQLVAGAMENFARFQSKQPLAAFNAVETAAKLFQRAFDPRKGLGAAAEGAPRTRFNGAVQGKRSYAVGEMPISAVKAIAKASETKINDVFLAICGGGLRRYFERRGELPERSLVAGCPVSLRKPGDESTNNQVTMMLVSMASSEADPKARLQQIARSSQAAKGFTADVAGSYDADIALPGMPNLVAAAARAMEGARLADLPAMPLPCNVVVSNVPGPQLELYSCGARVLTHYPVSIPAHTQGVNITVQSYNGALYYAITACAKALPDAGELRDDLAAAFAELADAFGVELSEDLPSARPFEMPLEPPAQTQAA